MAKMPPRTAAGTPKKKDDSDHVFTVALTSERIRSAMGTDDVALQNRLVNQALAVVSLQKGQKQDDAIMATLAAFEAIAPTDGLEGVFATQMVATHEAAMECLRRANIPGQSFEGRDVNLKHAEKLLQIYARQMEALDKHRGRGQQKITVEHVNVHAGGQAVVGHVHASAAPASEAPAQSLALSHQAQDVMPLPDPLAPASKIKQAVRRKRR